MSIIKLTASDDFTLGAYLALPEGDPDGAVVVIQEIFGVNEHIRQVADEYAGEGYAVIAPALFDRQERDVQLGYATEDEWNKGMQFAFESFDREAGMRDIQAAIALGSQYGRVGIVGYCFGGLLVWLAASQVNGLSAASSYYGAFIGQEADKSPRVPTCLHFGTLDTHIPASEIDIVEKANPEVTIYRYNADHGFNCDHRDSYHAESAALARRRTLELFTEHLR